MAVNCLELDEDAVAAILKAVLYEFPMQELDLFLPPWVDALPADHPIKAGLYDAIRQNTAQLRHIREVEGVIAALGEASTSVRPESQPSTWAPAWPLHGWPCPGSCSTRPCRSSPALRWGMMGI